MKKVVLITGASDGLGREFALKYSSLDYKTVLVSRNEEKLKALTSEINQSGGDCEYITADLSSPLAPESIFVQLNEKKIKVHTLINNAGLGDHGDFISCDLKKQQDIVEVNILSLTKLARLALDHMNELNAGLILNVSSTAAFQPGPFMSVFFASKAYVLSFSEALRNELTGSGIQVVCLCPGPIDTPFLKNSKMEESNMLHTIKPMSAKSVVEASLKGINKNKAVIIPGVFNKFLSLGYRVLPRNLVTSLSRHVVEDI
jgi:short-subunit dehydrogenase